MPLMSTKVIEDDVTDDGNFGYDDESSEEEDFSRTTQQNLRSTTGQNEADQVGQPNENYHPSSSSSYFNLPDFSGGRKEIEEAYRRQVEEFNRFTKDFQTNHPRISNFFIGIMENVAKMGREMVFFTFIFLSLSTSTIAIDKSL